MAVATLSAKDAKTSISKATPKKSLRKAMQSPYETIWPICNNVEEMEELMQRLLSPAKRRNNRVPWSEFRKMTEVERKQAKEKLRAEGDNKGLRKQLAYGMNELIFAIEKHNLASGVLSDDLVPSFTLNLIIEFATVHRVPIIVFPKLRKLTTEVLGFPCSCLGVKKNTLSVENSHFYPMHQKIVEMASKYELPENATLCRCPRDELIQFHQFIASYEGQDEQKSGTQGPCVAGTSETGSAWPCLEPGRKSYWRMKKDGKKEERRRARLAEDVEEGMEGKESSVPVVDDLLPLDKVMDIGEISSHITSKGETSACQSYRKRIEAHPYLRTFSKGLGSKMKKQVNLPSTSDSANGCGDGNNTKKTKGSMVTTENEKSPQKDFKYSIRRGKKSREPTYLSLKLSHF